LKQALHQRQLLPVHATGVTKKLLQLACKLLAEALVNKASILQAVSPMYFPFVSSGLGAAIWLSLATTCDTASAKSVLCRQG
jgi:hypothetical protein